MGVVSRVLDVASEMVGAMLTVNVGEVLGSDGKRPHSILRHPLTGG